MKPTCLIIDDEPVARKGLAEDLAALGLVKVLDTAADTREADAKLALRPADLLFLDIEMPGSNGLDFLSGLPVKPLVILITAYPQYALKGYEYGVIDYLVKPVSLQRLRIACEKAVEQHTLRHGESEQSLYLKYNGALEKIDPAAIFYIEAANNYIRVHLADRKLLIYQSLKGIEEQLPKDDFVQVHKSYLVAIRHIQRVEAGRVLVGAHAIPLSRRFRSDVLAKLRLTNKTRPLE